MAHIAQGLGLCTGFTTTEGIYLDGKQIVTGDCTGSQSANVILQDPLTDFASLECARGGIIRSGLAFDECDVGIVTNVAADHLGLKDIFTIEEMARVKAVVPNSVKEDGYAILNASIDLVYQMAKDLRCKIGLFSLDAENKYIQEHCKKGGIAAVTNAKGDIVIREGDKEIIVENVENIPITLKGRASFMTENVLPAVLAAYVLKFRKDYKHFIQPKNRHQDDLP
jgi:cyanophycin synthetase